MATFKDRTGREWVVEVNPTAMKRVREATGVHLGTVLNDDMAGLAALMADPIKLVDVLYVLCRDQAERHGLTDEGFGRQLDGDAYDAAADAFTEALANFSRPRLRNALRAMLRKEREYRTAAGAKAAAEFEAIDVAALLAEAEKTATSKNSAGNSPASSASTPGG